MVIKIKTQYADTELGRDVRPGEVLTVSDERGELLVKGKVAEKIGDGADPAEVAELKKQLAALEKENKKLREAKQ